MAGTRTVGMRIAMLGWFGVMLGGKPREFTLSGGFDSPASVCETVVSMITRVE